MYYCNRHIPKEWNLGWLTTGNFTGASHAPFRAPHTGTKASKPQNGVFIFGSDANRYQAFSNRSLHPTSSTPAKMVGFQPSMSSTCQSAPSKRTACHLARRAPG